MNNNEYFQISIKKETVEKVKTAAGKARNFVSSMKEVASEKIEDISPVSAVDGAYENDLFVVDECIVPTEQEIPIRQYNIARLSTPLWKKAYGRLQVTNKRVLFRSTGKSLAGPVMIENEFSIEELSGIEIKSDYRFDLLTFFLSGIGTLLMWVLYVAAVSRISYWSAGEHAYAPVSFFCLLTICATVVLFIRVRRRYAYKSAALYACGSLMIIGMLLAGSMNVLICMLAVLLLIGAFVMSIFAGIVDDLHILIKVKGAIGTIEIGRKLRSDERSGFAIVSPWKDTEIAIREIGALLDDVKRFGDAGIDKWKV